MAVEARHFNLFTPQLIGNREMMNHVEGNTNLYSNQMGYGIPLSGTTTAETLLPTYNSIIVDSSPATKVSRTAAPARMKSSDSGCFKPNLLPQLPRKRVRIDSTNSFVSYPSLIIPKPCGAYNSYSFLGEEFSTQIQQQQSDIDRLISEHMELVRSEMEEKRKRQAKKIIEAIEIGMIKKLRAKEEEIEKMGRLNWALEERVKSLCMENQIWRDMAHNNEATANTLRTNLEHVLAQQVVREERTRGIGSEEPTVALMDDAESCCGSNDGGCHDEEDDDDDNGVINRWRNIDGSIEKKLRLSVRNNGDRIMKNINGGRSSSSSGASTRLCKNCGNEESCVLVLPCRHLCLCTACSLSTPICPVCKSAKKTSLPVIMS